jgi:hypothetical protein
MRNACRPTGRFFCLLKMATVLIFMATAGQAQTSSPATTQITEGLFGHKSGADKKNTAMTLAQSVIQASDAVAGEDIIDPNKFQDGLSKVIDGVVAVLNSSVWAKSKQTK